MMTFEGQIVQVRLSTLYQNCKSNERGASGKRVMHISVVGYQSTAANPSMKKTVACAILGRANSSLVFT